MDLEAKALVALTRLGPAPKPIPDLRVNGQSLLETPPPGSTWCACRLKIIPIEEVQKGFSGIIPFLDGICSACEKNTHGMIRIVCMKCRDVVARMAPYKDKCGFVFQPWKFYHVSACPNCKPSLEGQPLQVIEKFLYLREKYK